MKNKLLNKYLLPYYVFAGSFFLIAATSLETLREDSKIAQIIYQDNLMVKKSHTRYFLISVFVLASIALGTTGIIHMKKSADKQIREITKEYIEQLLQTNPELQKYTDVLENQKSLQYIAAVACNGLSKDEIADILYIVNTVSHGSEKSDFELKQNIFKMHEYILKLIKEHANTNPQYAQDIINAIETAHRTHVYPLQSRER